MRLYCGTSGFSYKAWKGLFYPEKLPANQMLAYYGSRLPAVEINNTFYRLPGTDLVDGWRDQVPDDFRFVIKATRRISHVKRLKECEDEAARLFDVVSRLGQRLGAVLVQLPPNFHVDVARLEAFLRLVPEEIPLAFEFRHESWQEDDVREALERRSAAWVVVDNDGNPPPAALPMTAPWTYLRLRAPSYSVEALRAWHERCAPFERAFVFFKHEDEAVGPALAERMLQL